jgi:hypothetical protein
MSVCVQTEFKHSCRKYFEKSKTILNRKYTSVNYISLSYKNVTLRYKNAMEHLPLTSVKYYSRFLQVFDNRTTHLAQFL